MRYNINNNIGEFVFFQLPKSIQFNEDYKGLSVEARYLYMLMYDRNKVSIANNWIDSNGDIYIYFSIGAICDSLDIKKQKAIKLKKELTKFKLIEEVRQGLNKPNIIYVNVPKKYDASTENARKFENHTSGVPNFIPQDVHKTESNNNKYNNNKRINSVSSIDGISMEDFYSGMY